MRSVTSWFNATLFKKNLKRFWPVWGLYLAIWMIHFPIGLIMGNHNVKSFAKSTVLNSVMPAGFVAAVAFSILAAMAVWSYLYNHRSACLMHQLPIRREGLFLTNYLSGLNFMVGPNVVVFVLTLLAELAVGQVNVVNLLVWLAAVTLMEIFFFSFATVCALFTGHLLALPAFYAILSGLCAAVVSLLEGVLSNFVFGFAGLQWLETLAMVLTPAWMMGASVGTVRVGQGDQAVYHLEGWGCLAFYAVIGLVLALIALAVYRRRHVETAGDSVTVRWMRPIFQYGVASCCALAFGSIFFSMFTVALPDTAWTLLFFMLIFGAAGYFIARMLLEKTFRVFRKWKGCVVFMAVLAALTCAMEFDLTGFERYVPSADKVAEVYIDFGNTGPYDTWNQTNMKFDDPEVVRGVLAVHQAIVDEKDLERDWSKMDPTVEGYAADIWGRRGLSVTYTLTDGRTISRDFQSRAFINMEQINDPKSLTAKMDALINLPQVTEKAYALADRTAGEIREMGVTSFTTDEGYGFTKEVAVSNDPAVYAKLLAAIQKDLEEGNLGRRYLLNDKEYMNTTLVNQIYITFNNPYDSYYTGDVHMNGSGAFTEPVEVYSYKQYMQIGLQITAKHTLAVLEQEGVLTGRVNLLTQAQGDAVDGKWSGGDMDWSKINLDEYAWAVIGK